MERQELHCHNCNQYVRFSVDLSWTGRFVLNCPNCGHEHCRIIAKGRITEERWDRRNGGQTYIITTGVTTSATSFEQTSTASNSWTQDLWINSASTGNW